MKEKNVELDFSDPNKKKGKHGKFVARYPDGSFEFDFIEYNMEDKKLTLFKKMQSDINDFDLCKIGEINYNSSMDPFLQKLKDEDYGITQKTY